MDIIRKVHWGKVNEITSKLILLMVYKLYELLYKGDCNGLNGKDRQQFVANLNETIVFKVLEL